MCRTVEGPRPLFRPSGAAAGVRYLDSAAPGCWWVCCMVACFWGWTSSWAFGPAASIEPRAKNLPRGPITLMGDGGAPQLLSSTLLKASLGFWISGTA